MQKLPFIQEVHIALSHNLNFENFVHDDCDGLHREDKPYMTVIPAYAAYGYHLRRTTSVTSAYKKQFE